MYKNKGNIQHIEAVKKIVMRERGKIFWEEFLKEIESSQDDNFIEGYKYAIQILEDGLIGKNKRGRK